MCIEFKIEACFFSQVILKIRADNFFVLTRSMTVKDLKIVKPNYFVIPAITIVVAWLKKYLFMAGAAWFKGLQMPAYMPPMWFQIFAWKSIFIYTTLTLVLLWNIYPHTQRFWHIISLFIANAFFLLLGHYLFFVRHHLGAALFCVIAVALTLWTIVWMLWDKGYRLLAGLLLPYAILVCVGLYNVNALWLLNS